MTNTRWWLEASSLALGSKRLVKPPYGGEGIPPDPYLLDPSYNPIVSFFLFGSPTDSTSRTYGWVDDWIDLGLVQAGDVALCAVGVQFNSDPDVDVTNTPLVAADFTRIDQINTWSGGNDIACIIRTTGNAHVDQICDDMDTGASGASYDNIVGVCMTYEVAQEGIDYLDPVDVGVAAAEDAMFDNHEINANRCAASSTQSWTVAGGRDIQWAWQVGTYGSSGALMTGGAQFQFQADLKDGQLFRPGGTAKVDYNPYLEMIAQMDVDGFPVLLLPQICTFGTNLTNAITDVDLAMRGTKYVLDRHADGVMFQWETHSGLIFYDMVVEFLTRLNRS